MRSVKMAKHRLHIRHKLESEFRSRLVANIGEWAADLFRSYATMDPIYIKTGINFLRAIWLHLSLNIQS